MKYEPANLIKGEIFARCRAHFCRVTGAEASQVSGRVEKAAIYSRFCGCPGFFYRGMAVA